jgi:TolA-binding protein
VALLLLLSGCVYFNTFYLARRHYRDAEEIRLKAERENRVLPNTARDSYAKSLQYATKVLAEHADSKWVEEALILSQKALYYQGDLAASTRKGQELIQTFPESEWIPEARLFLARGYAGLGEFLNAASQAEQAAEQLTGRLKAEARLARAQSLEADGQFDLASREFQDLIHSADTPPDLARRARLAHAALLDGRGAYEEAAVVLVELLDDASLPLSIRTETLVDLIDLYFKAEDLEAAEAAVGQLEALDDTDYYKGVLRYYRGLFQFDRGRQRQAVDEIVRALLDGVTIEWEARIRLDLGRLMEGSRNWVAAAPEYQVLNVGLGTQSQRAEAFKRHSAILRLFALRSLIAQTEEDISFNDPRASMQTAAARGVPRAQIRQTDERVRIEEDEDAPRRRDEEIVPLDPVEAGDVPPGVYLYLLAEHFALEMGYADSAAAYLDQVVRLHPDSELVPRALFAMWEWVPADENGRQRAEAAVERLTSEFADTRWTYYHLRRVGEDPQRTTDLQAEDALLEIEEKVDPIADSGEWAAVIPEFYSLADRFPGTEAARKAELIAASLLELGAGDADSARVAYQRVLDRYPGSEQARDAQLKLAGGIRVAILDPQSARGQAIAEEMRSWGTWFNTLTAAKVTRLQSQGTGIRALAMPMVGTQEEARARNTGNRRPPPTNIPPHPQR